jgi:hypothetical protein
MNTVSERNLIRRINRRLANEQESLRKTRGTRWWSYLGDYYIEDCYRNTIVAQHVNPEKLGRQLDVLRDNEQVT